MGHDFIPIMPIVVGEVKGDILGHEQLIYTEAEFR